MYVYKFTYDKGSHPGATRVAVFHEEPINPGTYLARDLDKGQLRNFNTKYIRNRHKCESWITPLKNFPNTNEHICLAHYDKHLIVWLDSEPVVEAEDKQSALLQELRAVLDKYATAR
jgi:hypothetical protein